MTSVGRRRGQRLVLALLVVLAGWLAVRHAALAIYSASRPDRALMFAPADPVALSNLAYGRILDAGGAVDAEARALIRAALRRAPGDAAPVVLAALAASADGDLPRATALMRIAKRIDPRSDIARYWLLDHAVRGGDYSTALGEIGPALRLRPGTGDALLALVAGLLDSPGGPAAIRAALATDPDWRNAFFQREARGHALALLALLGTLPPPRDPDAAWTEQSSVLAAAVDQGAILPAYKVWSRLAKIPDNARHSLLYDPDFRGSPAPPPFNWRLDQAGGVRIASGALLLSFSGDQPRLLAEQYALAAPGRYALSFAIAATDPATDPGLERDVLSAHILCAGDGAELAAITLSAPAGGGRPAADFVVPPDCPAIRIQLVGRPDGIPDPIRIRVTGIAMRPL